MLVKLFQEFVQNIINSTCGTCANRSICCTFHLLGPFILPLCQLKVDRCISIINVMAFLALIQCFHSDKYSIQNKHNSYFTQYWYILVFIAGHTSIGMKSRRHFMIQLSYSNVCSFIDWFLFSVYTYMYIMITDMLLVL